MSTNDGPRIPPRPTLDADVAVVGAGPAGPAAAITLARAGRQVVLIDRATFPRDKCCGDGLTVAALRRLEDLGLDPAGGPELGARARGRGGRAHGRQEAALAGAGTRSGASSPPRPGGPTSTPPWSTWPARRAPA